MKRRRLMETQAQKSTSGVPFLQRTRAAFANLNTSFTTNREISA